MLLAVVACLAARSGGELATRYGHASGELATRYGHASGELAAGSAAITTVVAIATVVVWLVASMRRRHQPRPWWLALVAVVFVAHGAAHWQALATPRTGSVAGVGIAITDATWRRSAVTLIVKVEGQRFRLSVYGRERSQLRTVRMGDHIVLEAQRHAYDARRLRFVAGRHVQGELRQVRILDVLAAPRPWHRAANRIHELIDRGSRTMQPHDAALVRGFLLGDESRHPQQMTAAFRGAGLGHLLAVSGQNVALILAALTPLLRRLTRWPRLVWALGIVAMFAIVTRLESSVVRAAVMAGIVQVGYAIGRDVAPLRALAFTVVGLVAIDPLATWSIGFVLSVAATAGLVVLAPLLGSSMLSATTAAQLAVSPFVLWWFRSLPSVALATNVLAVPVASAVMMCAPVLLAIGAFAPDAIAVVLAAPVVAAVRWVWWVAEWGTRLSPPAALNVAMWLVVLATVAHRVVTRRTEPRPDR